jgi:hypothetical protein
VRVVPTVCKFSIFPPSGIINLILAREEAFKSVGQKPERLFIIATGKDTNILQCLLFLRAHISYSVEDVTYNGPISLHY